jgi:SAM-dependent methyltransferase
MSPPINDVSEGLLATVPHRLLRALRPDERRTPAQLWEQYQVEKALADRLRNASRSDRRELYSSAYEELFRRIPHHSQLTKKASPAQRALQIADQMRLLQPFLKPNTTFVEIGAGDCALSLAAAKQVKMVYAVDVSAAITHSTNPPANFKLILSDGTSIPVPPGSVDLAYSNQLMEHLHPDDAVEQLSNIYAALAPGGRYVCLTPNRLTGPHDISAYFDQEATGFHLKEYTTAELRRLFRAAGFKDIRQYARLRGCHIQTPNMLVQAVESSLATLTFGMRTRIARTPLVRALIEIRLIARK